MAGERASASSAGRPSARASATTRAARLPRRRASVPVAGSITPPSASMCSVTQATTAGASGCSLRACTGGDLPGHLAQRGRARADARSGVRPSPGRTPAACSPLDTRTEGIHSMWRHGGALGEQLRHLPGHEPVACACPARVRRSPRPRRARPGVDVDLQRQLRGHHHHQLAQVQRQLDRLEVEAVGQEARAEPLGRLPVLDGLPLDEVAGRQLGRRDGGLAGDLLGLARCCRRPCACAAPGSRADSGICTSPQRAMPSLVFTLTMLWVRIACVPSGSTRSTVRSSTSTAGAS